MRYENFPVAHLAGLGGLQNHFDGTVQLFVRHDQFDLQLGQKVHAVLASPVKLLVPPLPAKPPVFKVVDVKAGHFEIDYGDHRFRRSDNARVQRNHLIGNYVVDPKTVEIGLELVTEPRRFNLMVGVGNGGTTEKFTKGTGLSFHSKVWADITESLRASGSFYRVDHSGNKVKFSGSWGNLFSGHRSGGPYSAVLSGGNSPGQITPGAGQKVTATQFDVTWNRGPLEIYGHYGWMQDADLNGSEAGTPKESWNYYTAESILRFTPNLYSAIRYSGAKAERLNDLSSEGLIDRIQIGGGFWLTKNILAKVEYVHQGGRNFNGTDGNVGGVEIWRDPVFKGLVSEVSFAF